MNTQLLSLNQAAKEAGKSTSTISKYLKNGKLSYISKDDSGYKIDAAELFRVFPKENSESIRETQKRKIANTHKNTREYIELQAENKILNERLTLKDTEINLLSEKADDLKEQRNSWQKQAETLLLKKPDSDSDGQGTKQTEKPPEKKKGLLARIFS